MWQQALRARISTIGNMKGGTEGHADRGKTIKHTGRPQVPTPRMTFMEKSFGRDRDE